MTVEEFMEFYEKGMACGHAFDTTDLRAELESIVAVERERCAKIADTCSAVEHYGCCGIDIAAKIREGK